MSFADRWLISCGANQGGELQVLTRDLHEFDATFTSLQLVAKRRGLRRPESGQTLGFPSSLERAKAGRAELLGAGCEGQTPVGCRLRRTASARSEEPVELLDFIRHQPRAERIPDGIAIECARLPKPPRNDEADRPFVDGLEQLRMAQEKQPKLRGNVTGYQVEEHVTATTIARGTDGELVGKESGRLVCAQAEREMGIPVLRQIVLQQCGEVVHL